MNWREQLSINERRTYMVITIFILIYITIGLLIDLYIHPILNQYPLDQALEILLTFKITPIATLIFGGIAAFSIFITYQFHDRLMLLGTQYHEVTRKNLNNLTEQQLYNIVEELKIASGLHYIPKVYIIEADYMNAFASGYSEKSALITVTRGLLNKLERSELQAVVAHELSHIRHNDIKLTLMASVLSNIMLIAIDILFHFILFSKHTNNEEDSKNNPGNLLSVAVLLLRFLLPLTTIVLMLYLSRKREFMADAGAVELTRDNNSLAKALIKISNDPIYFQKNENIRDSAYIFSHKSSILSTHPTLEERLKALGYIK